MLSMKTLAISAGLLFSAASLSHAQAVQEPTPPAPPINPSSSPIPAPTSPGQSRDAATIPVSPNLELTVPMPALADGQIAGIMQVANDAEIRSGKMAVKKAQGQEVKRFARMMVDDHSMANRELRSVVAKKGIELSESDSRLQLSDKAKAGDSRIQALKGAAFDKAYIDEQVMMHQDVLTSLDSSLLLDVKDADLKQLLEKIRPKVAKHLEDAKNLQNNQTAGR